MESKKLTFEDVMNMPYSDDMFAGRTKEVATGGNFCYESVMYEKDMFVRENEMVRAAVPEYMKNDGCVMAEFVFTMQSLYVSYSDRRDVVLLSDDYIHDGYLSVDRLAAGHRMVTLSLVLSAENDCTRVTFKHECDGDGKILRSSVGTHCMIIPVNVDKIDRDVCGVLMRRAESLEKWMADKSFRKTAVGCAGRIASTLAKCDARVIALNAEIDKIENINVTEKDNGK